MQLHKSVWFKERKILLIGYVFFVTSLALPSLLMPKVFGKGEELYYGFECLWAVYLVTFGFMQILDFFKMDKETFITIYAFANTAMIFSPVLIRSQRFKFSRYFFALMFVFTVFIVAAPYFMNVVSGAGYQYLIGFYFWAASFVFCTIALLLNIRRSHHSTKYPATSG